MRTRANLTNRFGEVADCPLPTHFWFKSFSTFAFTAILMSGGQPRKPSEFASLFSIVSMPNLLPDFISRAGQGVIAYEEISGAKSGRTFQQQHCAKRGERRRKPRPVQCAVFRAGPCRAGKIETTHEFLRGRGKISILDAALITELRGE